VLRPQHQNQNSSPPQGAFRIPAPRKERDHRGPRRNACGSARSRRCDGQATQHAQLELMVAGRLIHR
jgi:hypothetical protein